MSTENLNPRPTGGSEVSAPEMAAEPRSPGRPVRGPLKPASGLSGGQNATRHALSAAKSPVPYSLLHFLKDLRIEWRSRDAINSMLFFSLLVVVIFSLAFDPTRELSREIAGPIICVAILFAAVTALNQTWARELRNNVLEAHRMSPAPAASLFIGKVLANFLFVSVIELLLTPLFAIFYNLSPLGNAWLLLLAVPLGTWAILVNGTFFAALSIRSRNRELLLPLILFPIFMPALLSMILAITAILTGDTSPDLWIKMLAGYDVIFTAISLLLFETVLNAE